MNCSNLYKKLKKIPMARSRKAWRRKCKTQSYTSKVSDLCRTCRKAQQGSKYSPSSPRATSCIRKKKEEFIRSRCFSGQLMRKKLCPKMHSDNNFTLSCPTCQT